MTMCNLLEYSANYKKPTGSLWNYYRYERSNPLSTILNLSNTRQVLQEILTMLMMMITMMQIKLVKIKPKLLFTKTFK